MHHKSTCEGYPGMAGLDVSCMYWCRTDLTSSCWPWAMLAMPSKLDIMELPQAKRWFAPALSAWKVGWRGPASWSRPMFFEMMFFSGCFRDGNCNGKNMKKPWYIKVTDLSPTHFRKQSATDGTYRSKYWFPGFGGLIQGQIYNPVYVFLKGYPGIHPMRIRLTPLAILGPSKSRFFLFLHAFFLF